jgi:hypothetical protein
MPSCRAPGVLLGLLALAGCAARGNLDALESELRQQEDLRVALEDRLSRLETDLRVAQSDADSLRSQLAKSGRQTLPMEQSQALHRASKLTLHAMMTGGWDNDPAPGDEGLTVLLSPVDEHGDLVKLGGDIEVELLDLSQSGEQQRLGSWSIPRDEVSGLWHKGLLGSGFLVRVPWQSIPQNERLTVVARLKTVDGRKFDATHQVVITPPAGPLADTRRESPPVQYKLRVESISLPNRMVPLDEDEVPGEFPEDSDSAAAPDDEDASGTDPRAEAPSEEDQRPEDQLPDERADDERVDDERALEDRPVPPPVEPGEAVPAPAPAARPTGPAAKPRGPKVKEPAGKAAIDAVPGPPSVSRPKPRPSAGVKPTGLPATPPAEPGLLESDSYLRDNPRVRR